MSFQIAAMSLTLYNSSIAVAKCALNSMSHLLTLAEAQPNSANLLSARLHEDMQPLPFQVHNATNIAKRMLDLISGVEPIEFDQSPLNSFAAMQGRISQTIAVLDAVDRDSFDERCYETVPVAMGPDIPPAQVSSLGYALGAGLPNIFFHLSMAYAILRNASVPIGKGDYISSFISPYLPKC